MLMSTFTPAIVGTGNTSPNAKKDIAQSNFFILEPHLSKLDWASGNRHYRDTYLAHLTPFFMSLTPVMASAPVMASTSFTPAVFVPPWPTSSDRRKQHHQNHYQHNDSLHGPLLVMSIRFFRRPTQPEICHQRGGNLSGLELGLLSAACVVTIGNMRAMGNDS
jgi:hypothetical protein